MNHFTAGLCCIVMAVLLPALQAGVHVVRPDSTGDFPTIQAAVDAAVHGDTISLRD